MSEQSRNDYSPLETRSSFVVIVHGSSRPKWTTRLMSCCCAVMFVMMLSFRDGNKGERCFEPTMYAFYYHGKKNSAWSNEVLMLSCANGDVPASLSVDSFSVFKKRQKTAHTPHIHWFIRDDSGQGPRECQRQRCLAFLCPWAGLIPIERKQYWWVFFSCLCFLLLIFCHKKEQEPRETFPTTSFFLISSSFRCIFYTFTISSIIYCPAHPDSLYTMTRMPKRRHVCFSLIVLGLCSLSMPNVGHVHGLSVPPDHLLFPATAHAPHSSYLQLGSHPSLTHKRSQRTVADLAVESEDDLLQELLTLAVQGNDRGSYWRTMLTSVDSRTNFFLILKT